MKEKIKSLKSFNYRLYFSLCLLALFPALYQTIKTSIISSTNLNDVFDVIGNMEWFDLINESLVGFLIIPLYSIFNKLYKDDLEMFKKFAFKIGIITCFVYSLFSIGVLVSGEILIRSMSVINNISLVRKYLSLETIAFMLEIIISFFNVLFITIGKDKNVYIFLLFKVVISLICDLVFIPRIDYLGIAISNIVTNGILAIICFTLLYFKGYIKISKFEKNDKLIYKEWLKKGFFSGFQQFVDNIIYALMICKMVNLVSVQGNYWLANNFIWGYLLLPILSLSEVVRSDCKEGYLKLNKLNYYFLITIIFILWLITIPLWKPFFKYIEKIENYERIFEITIKLIPFYICFAVSQVIDNIFNGLGKTNLNFINSLFVNFVYYGIFFILYLNNVIVFSMDVIILMFGFGMVFHMIISIILEHIFFKKQNIILPNDKLEVITD